MAESSGSSSITPCPGLQEHEQHMAAFGQVMTEAGDDYWQEFHEWDGIRKTLACVHPGYQELEDDEFDKLIAKARHRRYE